MKIQFLVGNDFYGLYTGTSYSTTTEIVYLPNEIELVTPPEGQNTNIAFLKLTGANVLEQAQEIIIRLKNSNSGYKITVTSSGAVYLHKSTFSTTTTEPPSTTTTTTTESPSTTTTTVPPTTTTTSIYGCEQHPSCECAPFGWLCANQMYCNYSDQSCPSGYYCCCTQCEELEER